MRTTMIAGGAVLGLMLAGCLDPYRRVPEVRDRATIFSPLQLPAPNGVRSASGLPGPEYWQQRVDYRMDATLDDAARTLHAKATITYVNNSPDALDFLWFELDQNLLKEDSTAMLASSLLNVPGFSALEFQPSSAGGMQIEAVRCNGEECEMKVHDTLGRIVLPAPLPPRGGTALIEIAWRFVVPPTQSLGRMGVEETQAGPVYAIAQWYPMVCVYDDVHGWNTLPYLGVGEFYSNFGTFDVRLTVPRDHIVVGTGVLQNPEEVLTPEQLSRLDAARASRVVTLIRRPDEVNDPATRPAGDGPLTWHFVAHDVRTFAWASSRAFAWDAAGILERGCTPAEQSGAVTLPDGILVQSVYPPEAVGTWLHNSTDMLRFSIEHYGKRWLPYPYPVATNVNALGAAAGMEYPMIVFCGERSDEENLFFVTTHEIGHTWFPMVVNTDERRYFWMDEGFNSFMNIGALSARYPDKPNALLARKSELMLALEFFGDFPVATHADQAPVINTFVSQYGKCAGALLALREIVLGPERFDDAFRRYVRGWAFKSPQPADFFRCMENTAGEDLGWFWRGWFYETGRLDQGIDAVRQPGQDGRAHVIFHNHRELVMPVVYRVTYQDGSTEMRRLPVEAWFTTNRWETSWPTGGRRIREIVIDPEDVLPDTNRGNNRWVAWW